MPKIEFTSREINYLKDLMYSNRMGGHSFYYKHSKKNVLTQNEDKMALLSELEINVFNKVMNTETDGLMDLKGKYD